MPVNRLKTTYQRNFFAGTMTSVIIATVCSVLLIASSEPVKRVKLELSDIVFTDIVFTKGGEGIADKDNSSESGGVKHGFKIPRQAPDVGLGRLDNISGIAGDAHNREDKLNITDEIVITPDNQSPGTFSPDPSEDHFGYMLRSASDRIIKAGLAARGVPNPGNPNRPLWINGLNVKHPPNPSGLVDTVIVMLTIGNLGQILNIETLYDALPNLGFARQFKNALYRSDIQPPFVNGLPVGGSYPIWCIFARSGDRETVKNTNNVTINTGQ